MKRKQVLVQVLYHGTGSLGLDRDEAADIQAAVRGQLRVSFLPSVQLGGKVFDHAVPYHEHAFVEATVLIFAGALSFYFLRAMAQRLGEETGEGVAQALKALGRKLWQGRARKSYSLRCCLLYVFSYRGIDCGLRITVPPGQAEEGVSKAFDAAFEQAAHQLEQLAHFIDQHYTTALSVKDTEMPIVTTTTACDEKGHMSWEVYTASKRTLFYETLDFI